MEQQKRFLTRQDLCDLLGLGLVSVDKLLKRDSDPIPSFRIGHKVRIPADMFNEWVAKETGKQPKDKFKKNARK